MSTIFTIIGLILIIMGFVVQHGMKKDRKENQNLKYGIVKNVTETDDGYKVDLEYLDEKAQSHYCTVDMNKPPRNDKIIIEVEGPLISVYDESAGTILLPIILWLLGMFFCAIWILL